MDDMIDDAASLVVTHLLIRDVKTGEVLLRRRGDAPRPSAPSPTDQSEDK